MIQVKSHSEVELMKIPNRLVAKILVELKDFIKPGISTFEIDQYAEKRILKEHAIPAFKGYGDPQFPCTCCISINEEVVHGIPSKHRILKDGDIVSVDMGAIVNGWFGDSARTYFVGDVKPEVKKLVEVTEQSFWAGFSTAVIGNRLGDICNAIQEVAESHGYGIVREFTGHGIGRHLHEDPSIPNYGRKGRGIRLEEGMIFAVEPMITLGSPNVYIASDEWTVVTADKQPAAHYENTFAITKDGPVILSCYEEN